MANVWVGTSGFSYLEWRGPFYPQDLRPEEFLTYYASRLKSVEIDSSFYRLPTPQALEKWRNATPEDFRFTLKAHQRITHMGRLRVPSEPLMRLNELARILEFRLGMIVYQLPPFFRYDLERLQAFLEVLPADIAAAMEFRHPSWYVDEVYRALEQHRVALCLLDTDEGCSPLQITSTKTCIRLRRSAYTVEERHLWRSRWLEWAHSGIEVFAYIKHKDNPNAPKVALDFAQDF